MEPLHAVDRTHPRGHWRCGKTGILSVQSKKGRQYPQEADTWQGKTGAITVQSCNAA